MSMKKTTIEIPQDIYDKFRVRCIKNHSSVKDEFTELICASLEAESKTVVGKEPQKTHREGFGLMGEGKEVVDDLDQPYVEPIVKKGELQAALTPILGMVEKLTSITQSQKADLDVLRGRLDSPQKCPQLEQFEEINKKFAVTGKLIDSVMVAIEKTSSAKKCDDDHKGLEYLKTPIPRLEVTSTVAKRGSMDKVVDDIFRGTLLE